MSTKPFLDAAIARREELQGKLDKLVAAPAAEGRTALTEKEERKFTELAGEIEAADASIETYRKQHEREERATAAAATGTPTTEHAPAAVVTSEPTTYDPRDKRSASYFQDLGAIAAAAARLGGTATDIEAAQARMARNAREVEVETRKAEGEKRSRFSSYIDANGGSVEQRVNPNTTYGQGGEFVPPLWLVSQYVPYMRPARTCANRVSNRALPPGIDVINLPKITGGSLTAIQATQGTGASSQDITTSTVAAPVRTIAGQEDISLQLLEQSPLQLDGVIFDDLSRDYDRALDSQILVGTGASGQHQGVITLAGVNAVTVASPLFFDNATTGTQYRAILNGLNAIETTRFDVPTGIWVHPRRSNSWRYTAVDSTFRPLFVPYTPFNALGLDNPNIPQGVAGELMGLPVVKDGNVPTTMLAGAPTGGTADPIIVLKEDDLILWEGTPRFRALPEILSGTLQIRFQMYCYSAFMPGRFPNSISVLTGNTGLAAPAF